MEVSGRRARMTSFMPQNPSAAKPLQSHGQYEAASTFRSSARSSGATSRQVPQGSSSRSATCARSRPTSASRSATPPDVIYRMRSRTRLPDDILDLGFTILRGVGRGRYALGGRRRSPRPPSGARRLRPQRSDAAAGPPSAAGGPAELDEQGPADDGRLLQAARSLHGPDGLPAALARPQVRPERRTGRAGRDRRWRRAARRRRSGRLPHRGEGRRRGHQPRAGRHGRRLLRDVLSWATRSGPSSSS